MLTPVQVTALLALQAVLLALAAAVAGGLWARRRIAAGAGRRLDRIEARLASIEAALRRIATAPAASGPAEARPPAPARPARPRRPAPPRRHSDREAISARDDAGPTLIAVPDLSGPSRTVGSQAEAARRASASGDLARRFGRIWSMADEGASPERIASATGHPIGQVELVLNLRRRLLDGLDDDRDPRADEVPA